MPRAKSDPNLVLTYRVIHVKDYNSRFERDILYIATMRKESLNARLAGTVDNHDGYGSGPGEKTSLERLAVAQRMRRAYSAMLDAGHTHIFTKTYNGADDTTEIDYQVYEDKPVKTHCAPSIKHRGSLGEMRKSLALCERIAKRVEKNKAKARAKEKGPESYLSQLCDVGDWSLESLSEVTEAIRSLGGVEIESYNINNSDFPYTFSELVEKKEK